MRGNAAKLGEECQKVRLGKDSLPNIAISVAETSGKWVRCFTRTLFVVGKLYAINLGDRKMITFQSLGG